MRVHLITLFIVILFLFPSCKNKQQLHNKNLKSQNEFESSETNEAPESSVSLDTLVQYFKLNYDIPPTKIIQKYGSPMSIDSTRIQNVHTGEEEDFIYTFKYPDKTIIFYYATKIRQYFLELVELQDVNALASFGFSPEVTPEMLHQLVGQETAVHQTPDNDLLYQYSLRHDVEEYIFFIFRNDKLVSIQYQPYLD